jgi:hypothetical protein
MSFKELTPSHTQQRLIIPGINGPFLSTFFSKRPFTALIAFSTLLLITASCAYCVLG